MATAAALPQANVRRPGEAFDPNIWVTVQNVPVFKEHTTTRSTCRACGEHNRDGVCPACGTPAEVLRFGREELEAIANRCNQRIRETGDYAALVIGHTPDP